MPKRTVHLFLFNEHGDLLLQKIGYNKPHAKMWGSSAAGVVLANNPGLREFGEAMRSTALRELGEAVPWMTNVGTTIMKEDAGKEITLFTADSQKRDFVLNHNEVAGLEYLSARELAVEVSTGARRFTPTFLHVYDYFLRQIQSRNRA